MTARSWGANAVEGSEQRPWVRYAPDLYDLPRRERRRFRQCGARGELKQTTGPLAGLTTPIFTCTVSKGHDGPHQAHGEVGVVVAMWEDGASFHVREEALPAS